MEQAYNGWKNYETWVVKLWLDNDEGAQELQQELKAQAQTAPKHEVLTREETTRFVLADLLKEFVEENEPDLGCSMYTDLLGAAIGEVDFQEIADNILSG